jgi:hypothetical protein
MRENQEMTTALVVFILFIFFVFRAFDDHPVFSWYTGERNVYPMTCEKDGHWVEPTSNSFLNVRCPPGTKLITIGPRTFIANKERQHVVEHYSNNPPRRYDDCVVYNADSWTCEYSGPDKGKYLLMTDGKITSTALPFVYVSKATWYWYRWTNK